MAVFRVEKNRGQDKTLTYPADYAGKTLKYSNVINLKAEDIYS